MCVHIIVSQTNPMAKLVFTLPTLCIMLLLLCFSPGGTLKLVNGQAAGQGSWCVAKPSTPDNILIENIEYACKYVNCSIIQEGGTCFFPQTQNNYASVAMNLYFQSQGRHTWNCDFKNTGIIAVSDPSYGDCVYPYDQDI